MTIKVGDIVSMPVPVYKKRRWWHYMSEKYKKDKNSDGKTREV
jgi:hypothetical protein